MSEPTSSRPRQVTLAGWFIMVGSAFVIVLVFERLAGLHTLETRESVEKFLAEPPGSDLGVGVDGVLTLIRTLAMVTAGCATAAAILGYQVLRRSRSARLALTVLAVPLFLAGMVTGGFLATIVAASSLMLWLQPSRDWFDGTAARRPGPAPAARASTPATPATPTTPTPPAAGTSRPAYVPTYGVPARRPPAVTIACVLTWVAGGLTALGMVLTGVLLAVDPDAMLHEMHRQNPELARQDVPDGALIGVSLALVAAIVVWCLAAVVLGALAFRGVPWARVVLIISAAVAAAVSLLGAAMGAFLLALTLIASVVTIALLVRPETQLWFRARR